MKKLLVLLGAAAVLALGAGLAQAVSDTTEHDVVITVNEIALIDLNDASDVTFAIVAPADAGDPFTVDPSAGDDTRWLWYTSLVQAGETRKITVEIDDEDNIPPGTELYVEPVADAVTSGGGCGVLGTVVADPILLNDTEGAAEDVVTGIGSGYTGRTDGTDGVQLLYTLDITDCGDLEADTYTVTVTYTLTDGA